MALEFIAALLVALALLNAWATRVVLRDDLSSQGQRSAQVVFIWLVPFLGALLTLHMKRTEPERSTGRYRDAPEPGDDFGYSTKRHRRTNGATEADGDSSADGASSD